MSQEMISDNLENLLVMGHDLVWSNSATTDMIRELFKKRAQNRQSLLVQKNEILENFKNLVSPRGSSVMLRRLIKVNKEIIHLDDSSKVQKQQLEKLHSMSTILQIRIR